MLKSIWAVTDLTHDAFLGGRLRLWQPKTGFRAGIDAVLLAAAVPARPGDTMLELGCGIGTASLCVVERVGQISATGIELQQSYAELARRNAAENDLALEVVHADLTALPDDVRNRQFSHVLMNPPYYDRSTGTAARDAGRDTALAGGTPMADWLDIGIKRLAPKGHLTLIMRIERLPEVLSHVQARLGSVVVRPIVARAGRAPHLFLLRGILAGRAPFQMAPPLVMHVGDTHEKDAESYTPQVHAILRDAAKLDIWP